MRYLMVLCLLVISCPAIGHELPQKVYLKSTTQSFTHEFDVTILEGRIWYRQKPATESTTPWGLLGENGLPWASSIQRSGFSKGDVPSSVQEISADGNNLIAIGSNGYIYYMKWDTRKWVDTWGKPFSGKLKLPEKIRSWSISHRGPFSGGYHDIDGNFHPISAGVTTLYTLSENGLEIHYADPWLPADFSHQICGPLRNRFRSRSLDASASTLFVISDKGEMYTRLADYDTLGNNRFLAYSYERKKRNIPHEKDIRTLPPEDWKKQPSIPVTQGRITSAISILQTGKGNDARELRVEGINTGGVHGFFSKPINDGTWHFTPTDLPLQKSFLSFGVQDPDEGPDIDQTLRGHIRLGNLPGAKEYDIQIKNYNPLCSGATLVIMLGSEKAEFPFLTTASSKTDRKMKGAILLPEELKTKAADNKVLKEFIDTVFHDQPFVKISIKTDKNGVIKVQSDSLFAVFPKLKMELSQGME